MYAAYGGSQHTSQSGNLQHNWRRLMTCKFVGTMEIIELKGCRIRREGTKAKAAGVHSLIHAPSILLQVCFRVAVGD